jgi:hypothetical protein
MRCIERFPPLGDTTKNNLGEKGKKGRILLQNFNEFISHTMIIRCFTILTTRDKPEDIARCEEVLPICIFSNVLNFTKV